MGAAVRAAEERFGGVDVLVNNAGYGYRAALEEGEDADVRQLFETHVFGTVRTTKAVLPGMRERRSGTIVNLSSIGARIAPEGSGYYAAVAIELGHAEDGPSENRVNVRTEGKGIASPGDESLKVFRLGEIHSAGEAGQNHP